MAKQNYLKLAVVVVLTMAASSAVYAGTIVSGGSIGGSSFTPSQNSKCYYASDGTANAFDGSNYGIACGHNSGDKIIGARNGDAKLYFATTTANNATAGAANIATNSVTGSTWTSM